MTSRNNDLARNIQARRQGLIERINACRDETLDATLSPQGVVYSDWTTDLDENYCFYVGKGKSLNRLGKLYRSEMHDETMRMFGLDRRIEHRADTERELLLKEVELIAHYETFCDENPRGTNMTLGGGGWLGYNGTKKQRERMRGENNPRFGMPTEHDCKTMARISATKRKRHPTRIAVQQLTLEGELIREWPSIRGAASALGFNHTAIGKACKNGKEFAYGHRWRYVDPDKRPMRNAQCMVTKQVKQIALDNSWHALHDSVKAAAEATGIGKNAIYNCCSGKSKTSGGCRWCFTGEKVPAYAKQHTIVTIHFTEHSSNGDSVRRDLVVRLDPAHDAREELARILDDYEGSGGATDGLPVTEKFHATDEFLRRFWAAGGFCLDFHGAELDDGTDVTDWVADWYGKPA